VAHFIDFIPKINTDLLTGVCFAFMAVLMAFGVTLDMDLSDPDPDVTRTVHILGVTAHPAGGPDRPAGPQPA
jgi:hypothetical protein